MATFVSIHKRFGTWMDKKKISFSEGKYATTDQKEINHLRNHPSFGKKLFESEKLLEPKNNLVTDVRSAGVDEMKKKFREYEELKARCLRPNGLPKKDAEESDLQKLEQLKIELEL